MTKEEDDCLSLLEQSKQLMRTGDLNAALSAINNALRLFSEDDRVLLYHQKLISMMRL